MKTFFIIIVLLFGCSAAYAQTIHLKSGQTVTGKIIERTEDHIKIDFEGIGLTYYFDAIEKIDGDENPAHMSRPAETARADLPEKTLEENVKYSGENQQDALEGLPYTAANLSASDFSPGEDISNLNMQDRVNDALGSLGMKASPDKGVTTQLNNEEASGLRNAFIIFGAVLLVVFLFFLNRAQKIG